MGELISVAAPRGALRRQLFLGTGLCAALLLSVGCTAKDEPRSKPTSSTRETPSESSESPEGEGRETVEVAPKIPDGKTVAAVANAKGNMEVPLKGGVRPGPLGIMVTCQGKGTVNISFAPSGLAFPLKCVDGKAITTYNQIDLKHKRDSASLSVQAESGVRWALSVAQ